MSGFEIEDEDVVFMAPAYSFQALSTFMVSQFKQALRSHLKGLEKYVDEGIDCSYLKASGGGWQKGKLRVRLEFVPDEPAVPEIPEGHERLLQ